MQKRDVPTGSSAEGDAPQSLWGLNSVKNVAVLWWAGLKDGVCFHRCIVYFVHDPQILLKTGQCLALNGVIFLGSILLWNFGLSPGARWLLQVSLHSQERAAFVDFAHAAICTAFGIVWLLPVYCLSFALSCVWYQDIANLALSVRQKRASSATGSQSRPRHSSQHQTDVMVQVAQELYRVVLFAVFLAQTYVAGLLPGFGWLANFLLLSFLNAFYSFDYKWSLSNKSLEERVYYFEWHWAYFAGFGSVCTLAATPWPFFTSAALVALLYPLFILVAADADPGPVYKQVFGNGRASGRDVRMQLPIFHLAISVTSWTISRGAQVINFPQQYRMKRILYFALLLAGLWACLIAWQSSRGRSQK